jgi:hypothetical protein
MNRNYYLPGCVAVWLKLTRIEKWYRYKEKEDHIEIETKPTMKTRKEREKKAAALERIFS